VAGLQQLNWDSEGVGSKAAALVDLSTVAGNKISNPPWVKFQSAGWVNFPSAPTTLAHTTLAAGYGSLFAFMFCDLRPVSNSAGVNTNRFANSLVGVTLLTHA
tara:strand:+ start:573 stop:881 length:309 start_codon:yes stop_codon:yes gene_type:complete